jgi:hypothetical protein
MLGVEPVTRRKSRPGLLDGRGRIDQNAVDARRQSKYGAVMIDTTDADEA